MLSKRVSSTIFESLEWLDPGLNPGLPGHRQTFYSQGQWTSLYIYIYICVCVCVCARARVCVCVFVCVFVKYCCRSIWSCLLIVEDTDSVLFRFTWRPTCNCLLRLCSRDFACAGELAKSMNLPAKTVYNSFCNVSWVPAFF